MKAIRVLFWMATGLLALPASVLAFYNPSTGRWLSRDPIGERGGINVYGFVRNGSTGRVDPLGTVMWSPPLISHCLPCKCVSVEITFNGKPDFNFGYYGFDPATYRTYPAPNPNAPVTTTRFGSAIDVKWAVMGDPTRCTFQQNEEGTSKFWTAPGPPPVFDWVGPQTLTGKRNTTKWNYVDPVGSNKSTPGYLKIELDLIIEFKCISSDGSSMARTATVIANAIGPIPQGPIYEQEITTFRME